MQNPYEGVGWAKRKVGSNELVRNQMNGLMNANGQYLSDARTRGANEGHRRGLLNSSLSAAGAEGSAIQAALPIASQDASTYKSAADMESGNEQQSTITGAQIAAQERANAASAASASAYAASSAAERAADRDWTDKRDIRNRGWSVEDRDFKDTASVRDRDAGYNYGRENRDAEYGYGRETRNSNQAFQRERENAGYANDQTVRNDNMFRDFMMPGIQSIASNPDYMANPEAMGGFFDFLGATAGRVSGRASPASTQGPVAKASRPQRSLRSQ